MFILNACKNQNTQQQNKYELKDKQKVEKVCHVLGLNVNVLF